MVERIIGAMESAKLSVAGILAAVAGIALIRTLLEALEAPTTTGYLPLDPLTIVHYLLFYLSAYLLLASVLTLFVPRRREAASVLLLGLSVLWLPPLIDLVVSGGAGFRMTYLFDGPAALLADFFTFFGPLSSSGVTLGIRVEFAVALLFIGWYVYRARKSVWFALGAMLFSYAAMFALVALPGVLYALSFLFPDAASYGAPAFFLESLRTSLTGANALPPTLVPFSAQALFETGFNKILSLVCFLLAGGGALLLAYRLVPEKLQALVKNTRPLRALHFLVLLALGGLVAFRAGTTYGWLDLLSFLVLVVAWLAAWLYAVCVNDLEDEAIDVISSPERPLIAKTLSRNDLQQAATAFLAASLLGAWSGGYYPFIFLLGFTACYYVYSASPLRLKRVPFLSSALIALASLFSVLAGWFLLAGDKHFIFPPLLLAGFVACFTFGVNVRDLKDIAGDMNAGIATVPTMIAKRFGTRAAFHAVGALLALAFVLSALVFPVPHLLYVAIPAALLGYAACIRTPYTERLVALVCASYFVAALPLYIYG